MALVVPTPIPLDIPSNIEYSGMIVAIATIAIVLEKPLLIVIVGGIYVFEAISVILQVTSFKLRKKRIFKMAPIHHHFEQCGWSEVKIVTIFSVITVILCVIGFISIFIAR